MELKHKIVKKKVFYEQISSPPPNNKITYLQELSFKKKRNGLRIEQLLIKFS